MRIDGRAHDALREVRFEMGFQHNAGGSCLVQFGQTRVLCAATCEEAVPSFLQEQGTGWLTAEYNMLPGSTLSRKRRAGADRGGPFDHCVKTGRVCRGRPMVAPYV